MFNQLLCFLTMFLFSQGFSAFYGDILLIFTIDRMAGTPIHPPAHPSILNLLRPHARRSNHTPDTFGPTHPPTYIKHYQETTPKSNMGTLTSNFERLLRESDYSVFIICTRTSHLALAVAPTLRLLQLWPWLSLSRARSGLAAFGLQYHLRRSNLLSLPWGVAASCGP